MVLSEAKSTAAAFGMTLHFSPEFDEYVVYPAGSSENDPTAYFTSDIHDAVDTARVMGREP